MCAREIGVALLFISRPVVGVASCTSPGIRAVIAQACPTEMVLVPVKWVVCWSSIAFFYFIVLFCTSMSYGLW